MLLDRRYRQHGDESAHIGRAKIFRRPFRPEFSRHGLDPPRAG
jgi:hypothetical protein